MGLFNRKCVLVTKWNDKWTTYLDFYDLMHRNEIKWFSAWFFVFVKASKVQVGSAVMICLGSRPKAQGSDGRETTEVWRAWRKVKNKNQLISSRTSAGAPENVPSKRCQTAEKKASLHKLNLRWPKQVSHYKKHRNDSTRAQYPILIYAFEDYIRIFTILFNCFTSDF